MVLCIAITYCNAMKQRTKICSAVQSDITSDNFNATYCILQYMQIVQLQAKDMISGICSKSRRADTQCQTLSGQYRLTPNATACLRHFCTCIWSRKPFSDLAIDLWVWTSRFASRTTFAFHALADCKQQYSVYNDHHQRKALFAKEEDFWDKSGAPCTWGGL